jgi:hypothetical protein
MNNNDYKNCDCSLSTETVFAVQTEPRKYPKCCVNNVPINPGAMSTYSSDFRKVEAGECPGATCPGTSYVSDDPRLYNAAAPSRLALDRPPNMTDVSFSRMYDDGPKYGGKYDGYDNINAGQISYYIDPAIQDTYYDPVFTIPSTVVGMDYIDPMSNVKPQYTRLARKYCPTTNLYKSGGDCLSFVDDSHDHREDLMALQQGLYNRTRYVNRQDRV